MHIFFRRLLAGATIFFILASGVNANALTISSAVAKPSAFSLSTNNKTITVRWAAPTSSASKITGYRVTAASGTWSKTINVAASARSAKFTSLINGKTYKVTLQSVSAKLVSKALSKSIKVSATLYANSIYFGQPADMFIGAEDQVLDGMSLGPVLVFTSLTPSICSINLDKVHAIALGDCIIRANAPASGLFSAATSVDRLLTIAVPPPPVVKTLLWSDEFSGAAGTAPDSAKWTPDTSDGCPAPYSNCGWGNAEKEYYVEGANRVDGSADGLLNINATRQTNSTSYNCYYGRCEWLSGKITTYKKVSFTYGYMEARIKLPSGGGAWPAFWMLGSNIATNPWPACGEIDIMEGKGNAPSLTWGTVHFADSNGAHAMLGGTKDVFADLSQGFHRYGMLWKPDEIVLTIDDNLVYAASKSESGLLNWAFGPNANGADPSFYLIFNLAMGGSFGGAVDSGVSSAQMQVDWVRYYSVDGLGKVTNG